MGGGGKWSDVVFHNLLLWGGHSLKRNYLVKYKVAVDDGHLLICATYIVIYDKRRKETF